MKQRHCRMTPEEKAIHKRAVSLRNMNDRELVEVVDKGKPSKEELMKERIYAVASFIENLKNIQGIGGATLEKVKRYAEEEGYI